MSILLSSSLVFVLPLHAERLSGRYLGTLNHSQTNDFSTDRMSHLYDATIHDVITRDVDLDLGASLRHDSRLGVANTAILQSRFFGDVKNTVWRVRSTYIPWQRTQPGNDERRRRDFTIGADLTPRSGPQLHLNFKRADRESELALTQSSDLRADLSYTLPRAATHLSVRHLESNGSSPKTSTDEFRGGINARHSWRNVAVDGRYDAIATGTQRPESRTNRVMQNVGANVGWSPHRKFSFSSRLSHRWENLGGAPSAGPEPRRTAIITKASVLPVRYLSLDLTRDFSTLGAASGGRATDFLRFTASYVRPLAHQVMFRSGFGTHFDLRDHDRDDTQTGLFIAANGRLRKDLQGGAEMRVSQLAGSFAGARWSTSANVRTKPTQLTTFDVRWRADRKNEIPGIRQDDRLWDFTMTYRPAPGLNMNVSHRRQNGKGRVAREERLWSMNVAWRLAARTSARAFGSTRRTQLVDAKRHEDAMGGDLTFWPTQNFELRTRAQYSRFSDRDTIKTYGVNLSRSF